MIARSKIIERSLRCLDFGLASLIPVIGMLMALVALDKFRSVVMHSSDRWNPARGHLLLGTALALLGLLIHGVVGVFFFLKLTRAIENA